MRTAPALLIVFMCVCLLTLQMSGLHLHVGANTHGTAHHGTHLHDADFEEHDHDADVDVSPFEPVITWSKLIPFLVPLIFALLIAIWASKTISPPLVEQLFTRRQSRWRPPLRAPPQLPL